jgi:hypothetical protein
MVVPRHAIGGYADIRILLANSEGSPDLVGISFSNNWSLTVQSWFKKTIRALCINGFRIICPVIMVACFA